MESLTATRIKMAIANSEADRREIEKAIELKPTETQDQLLNIRSLIGSFTSHGEALRSALREFE